MSIADDLRAAANKLHEARAGGDEVAIQCVEGLRRHAETIERVVREMKAMHDNNRDDQLCLGQVNEWAEALEGKERTT